jgi:hypothetical protein
MNLSSLENHALEIAIENARNPCLASPTDKVISTLIDEIARMEDETIYGLEDENKSLADDKATLAQAVVDWAFEAGLSDDEAKKRKSLAFVKLADNYL